MKINGSLFPIAPKRHHHKSRFTTKILAIICHLTRSRSSTKVSSLKYISTLISRPCCFATQTPLRYEFYFSLELMNSSAGEI